MFVLNIDAIEFDNDEQKKDSQVIFTKMEKYCIGECNETHERWVFNPRDQETNEPSEAYFTALRKLGKTCNYGALKELQSIQHRVSHPTRCMQVYSWLESQ